MVNMFGTETCNDLRKELIQKAQRVSYELPETVDIEANNKIIIDATKDNIKSLAQTTLKKKKMCLNMFGFFKSKTYSTITQ